MVVSTCSTPVFPLEDLRNILFCNKQALIYEEPYMCRKNQPQLTFQLLISSQIVKIAFGCCLLNNAYTQAQANELYCAVVFPVLAF